MTQTVTITHNKPEPKPKRFAIDRVPPLAADMCNARLRNGNRVRILAVNAPNRPVVVLAGWEDVYRYGRYGSYSQLPHPLDIIALDGEEPAVDEGLVRVGDTGPDDIFLFEGEWSQWHRISSNGRRDGVTLRERVLFPMGAEDLVRPLRPGESLDIRVVAS